MESNMEKRIALHLLNAIRESRVAKGSQLTLLFVLATRADPRKSFTCFPSLATLAADAGMSTSAVQRASRVLEKAGLIRRTVRCNRSTEYAVCFDALVELATRRKVDSGPEGHETVFDPDRDECRSEYETAWGLIETLADCHFKPDAQIKTEDAARVTLKLQRRIESLDDGEVEGIKAWIESGEATVVQERVGRCTTLASAAYALAKHFPSVIEAYRDFAAQHL